MLLDVAQLQALLVDRRTPHLAPPDVAQIDPGDAEVDVRKTARLVGHGHDVVHVLAAVDGCDQLPARGRQRLVPQGDPGPILYVGLRRQVQIEDLSHVVELVLDLRPVERLREQVISEHLKPISSQRG